MPTCTKPQTLDALRESGWRSKPIKQEIHDNFVAALARDDELYPGIFGYDDTVIPDLNNALIAMHDILFLGEKGQAKSRLMRLIVRYLDDEIPYLDIPGCPVHEDPMNPITSKFKIFLGDAHRYNSEDFARKYGDAVLINPEWYNTILPKNADYEKRKNIHEIRFI